MEKNISRIKNAILVFSGIFILACSSDPKDEIVGRWEHISKYTRDPQKHMEFLKDGTINTYSNGAIEMSARYVMANDGKSLLLQHPASPEAASFSIVNLNSRNLVMVMNDRWSRNDTLFLKKL